VKDAGDVVLTLGHSVGRGRGSGLEIDRHSATLWKPPEETLQRTSSASIAMA
jgi:hypothetical protein